MIIPIILLLVFVIAIFSGCLTMETFPVATITPEVSYEYHRIDLTGEVGVPFCKAKERMFVYDTVPHENWSDYAFRVYDNTSPIDRYFRQGFGFYDLKAGITYYVRAVAYCYDFKKRYIDYKDGYYQGNEKTFIFHW
jgi:hypothetical protein